MEAEMITEEQDKIIRNRAAEGIGLVQIAREIKTNRHTVAKYCKRNEIELKTRHHHNKDISKEELEDLIEAGASIKFMADKYDCAPSAIHHRLRRLGLRTKNRIGKDPHSLNYPKCEQCGKTRKPYYKADRDRCPPICGYCKNKIKEKTVKDQIVKLRGGKCERCGYDECIQALEFHHESKENKEEQVSTLVKDGLFNKAWDEAKKCKLLCSNCHRHHHYKDKWNDKFSEYPEIQEWVKERFSPDSPIVSQSSPTADTPEQAA